MRLRVLVLLSLTLSWPTVGFAFTADKRDTLRGLSEVSVLVEYLPDDVERDGLSREHLKRDIEVRLRQAGLLTSPQLLGHRSSSFTPTR